MVGLKLTLLCSFGKRDISKISRPHFLVDFECITSAWHVLALVLSIRYFGRYCGHLICVTLVYPMVFSRVGRDAFEIGSHAPKVATAGQSSLLFGSLILRGHLVDTRCEKQPQSPSVGMLNIMITDAFLARE